MERTSATALAEDGARRAALNAALREIDQGRSEPSVEWRRDFSLVLGLERLLSEEEPHLADGTTLSAHQVDALSGTLIALESELLISRNGSGNGKAASEELHSGELELEGDELPDEEPLDWDPAEEAEEEAAADAVAEDPGAARRFWFEHATGAGKTVAALGFVEASRTGGILILTHRRNLVDQFLGELRDRGYKNRISAALLKNGAGEPPAGGPVTVETYQWFVRNAGKVSDAYTIVICDEAHTALGEKTSGSIRQWTRPGVRGHDRHRRADRAPRDGPVPDADLALRPRAGGAARSDRAAALGADPAGRGRPLDRERAAAARRGRPGLRPGSSWPSCSTRRRSTWRWPTSTRPASRTCPGVVYSAGVKHAHNVAKAFQEAGMKAKAVSGETPKRELTRILAAYERGEIDVLVNAQLLAEGWNSPRATVCMHLAPTASKRIYQQRVGRVTRRTPGKESGIVVDFVHPATPNDDPVVTLHSLLDRDVYRGGAIVVGPVRRGRGRRLRVERRVVPVTADQDRRAQVFERELWRIAVEHLSWGEQQAWAMLAGARVASNNWRRAKAMLHFDSTGELRRIFLITCLRRNRNTQLRLRALGEVGNLRDAEAFDDAVEIVGGWSRDERREGVKVLLQALTERQIGRRDQAARWLWHLAEYSREVHEEYAVQRWPETKRLLGLLVNSAGAAHARNARRLVQASRKQDRRLSAALLAAALAHTPEAQQVLDGARMRMARKPSALARELLRNFPKGKRRRGGRRRKKKGAGEAEGTADVAVTQNEALDTDEAPTTDADDGGGDARPAKPRRKRSRRRRPSGARTDADARPGDADSAPDDADAPPTRTPRRTMRTTALTATPPPTTPAPPAAPTPRTASATPPSSTRWATRRRPMC